MKKTLLLFVAFLFGMNALYAQDETTYNTGEYTDDNGVTWGYTTDDDGYITIGKRGEADPNDNRYASACIPQTTKGEITVPTEIGGVAVKRLRYDAFHGCSELTKVTFTQAIALEAAGTNMFLGCHRLTEVDGLEYIDVSACTSMEHFFAECYKLNSVEGIEDWNISNCTDLEGFCSACYAITTLKPFAKWDTSNVTNLAYCFSTCQSLLTLEGLENWKVKKVTTMVNLFAYCYKLTTLEALTKWDTESVVNLSQTFDCGNYPTMKGLENWKTGKVTNMYRTFSFNGALTSVEAIKNWDVSSVQNMEYTFASRPDYGRAHQLANYDDLSGWDVSSVTNMNRTFSNDVNMTSIEGISKWNTANVKSLDETFYGCTGLTNVDDLQNWDLSSVTSAESTFENCSNIFWFRYMPTTLTVIGKNMFGNCSSSKLFKIPNSVKSIGTSAFYSTGSCKHITLPSHLTTLGDSICGGQTELTIPATVTSLSNLGYGTSVTKLYVLGTTLNENWKDNGVTIYVKPSVYETYSSWENVEQDIPLEYTGKLQYLTRCRDFDMDFSNAENTHVFVATGKNTEVANDVLLTELSGKYVPSRLKASESSYNGVDEYVGVLIEGEVGATKYYRIGENDCYSGNQTTTYDGVSDNMLIGANDQDTVVQKEEIDGETYYYYGSSTNKFSVFNKGGWTPYNRAYLKMSKTDYDPYPTTGSAKPLTMSFVYADGTTGIISAETFNEISDGAIYDLRGMRVNENYKGFVIKNGKKIFQK